MSSSLAEAALTQLEGLAQRDRLVAVALLVGAYAAGALVARLAIGVVSRWTRRTENPFDDAVVSRIRPPIRRLVPLLALRVVLPWTQLPGAVVMPLGHALLVLVIVTAAWLGFCLIDSVEAVTRLRFSDAGADDLAARSALTKVRGFRNVAKFLVGVFAVASALMTFEPVRQIGVSLFASAGVASVVIGFAAQRSLATMVAGVQIALTQPIRVDDVVIVEGEWGRIEEITLTYVVVRIWDERRLVVPITYFIEKPFQNWTRHSSEILGTVFLYVDYRVPMDALRAELDRILAATELWDGRVKSVVVTNATDRAVEVRALVSAADASKAWDLRCLVREKLIAFLQERYPDCLPRVRAELASEA